MKNRTEIKYAIVIALLQIESIFAQAPVFDDDVQDVPINDWILPMMLLGVGVVFFYLKKRQPAIK
ncbi:hypothetical protein [Flavobacterium sp.]|uniref:hypothetical protein n=1 Tax=Flavobacterium sp. TaxID=239 RepID=UPI0033412881